MKKNTIAELIKNAFFEGYDSYATPCCANNNVEDAWEDSLSKDAHDRILTNKGKSHDPNLD